METPGRIVATPDTLDFTVENVEKVNNPTYNTVQRGCGSSNMLLKSKTTWEQRGLICLVATVILNFLTSQIPVRKIMLLYLHVST